MFDENSIVVKTWVKAVRNGAKKIEDVPTISNLREVVVSIIKGGN